jgi:hypothetical protein
MPAGNVYDRNAGLAVGQAQVLGFGLNTAIDSHSYGPPGAKIFYVDPNNAQATDLGNLGEDPTVPLATIQAAVTLCRDHRGDRIVVAANDAWQYAPHLRPLPIIEDVIVPANKGGITISGMATNPLACVWTPTANNGLALHIRAIDVIVEGFAFYPGIFNNCTAIFAEWTGTQFGENFTVRNCYFDAELDYGIAMDYAWNSQIYGNHFDDVAIAAILNTSVTGDAEYLIIHDNNFYDCALAISLGASDGNFIFNNRIYGDGTGTNNFVDLTGGQGNTVSDNYLACTIAQYDVTCSDATSGAWINNHCTNGDTTAPPV